MNNQLSFSINVRDNASPALNSLKRQVSSLKSGISSLSSGTQAANNYIRSLNSGIAGANKSVRSFGGSVKSLIGTFAGLSVVRGIFNTIIGTFDRAIERLDTMDLFSQKIEMITGSADQAATALEHLKTSTKGTPYALDIAAKAVQNFVTRGMETSKATESVDIWMDAVSAYGKGTNEQFESVLDAISKMRTKGTVEMRYLNRLFAAGINPVKMYAQATGMATEEVQTALSEKTINTEDFLNVVETAMREGTNGVIKVQGMAKQLATTWAAVTQNMITAIARGWADLVEGLDTFTSFFNEDGLKGILKGFGNTTESILGGIGNSFKTLGQILSGSYSELERQNQETFDNITNNISRNATLAAANYSVAGKQFSDTFLKYFAKPMEEIIPKFLKMKETWSEVSLEFSRGIKQLSEPFARFASEYLGMAITGVEDLATAFGQWLNLKLPPFFDALERFLKWMTDNRDTIVASAKAIVTAMLSFKVLSGIKGIIVGFNNKLKELNDLLAFYTLGKIQIPTLENLVLPSGKSPKAKSTAKASPSSNLKTDMSSVIDPLIVTTKGYKPEKPAKVNNKVATKQLKAIEAQNHLMETAFEKIDLSKWSSTVADPYKGANSQMAPNLKPYFEQLAETNTKALESAFKKVDLSKNYTVAEPYKGMKSKSAAETPSLSDILRFNFSNAGDKIKETEPRAKQIVQAPIQYVKDSAVATGEFFSEGKSWAGEGIAKMGQKFKDSITSFTGSIAQGFRNFASLEEGSITSDFIDSIKSLVTKIKEAFEGTKDFGGDFLSNLVSGFQGLKEDDKKEFPSFDIKEFLSNLNTDKNGDKIFSKEMFKDTFSSLGQGAKNVASAPVHAAQSIGEGSKNFFGTMFQGFKDLGEGVGVGDIGDIIESIGSASEHASSGTSILAKAVSSLSTGFQTVVTWATSLVSTFGVAVTAIVGVTAGIGLLAAGLGTLNPGNTLSNGINKFFESFNNMCHTVAQNAPILIQNFVSGLISNLPKLVSQGVNLVLSVVNGILTGIPRVLEAGVSILFSLVSGILQVLPELVKQGFNAVAQFIEGVIKNIPNVLKAAWDLIVSFVKGMLSNGPVLIASGVKLIWNLITGIMSMMMRIGTAVRDLIVNGVSWVWNHPQEIWDAVKNLANELWEALLNGLYAAADMFNAGWILDALGAQRPEVAQAGTDTGQAAVDSAQQAIDSSSLDLQNVVQQANTDQASADAAAAGQQIGSSLTDATDAELASDSIDASAYGAETGTNYTDAMSSSITEGGANVDSALSSVGQEGLANLTVTFNSDQAAQAAAGLIQSINVALNENAFTLYQSIAVICNNCLVQLAAGFANLPDEVPTAIATAMSQVASEVQMKVTTICNDIKDSLAAAKTEADNTTRELAQAISDNFTTAQTSASASLQAMKTDVIAQYAELKDTIHSDLSQIEQDHNTFSTSTMESYKQTIDQGLKDVETFYSDFCTNIHKQLDDLATYHSNVAATMMDNLENGIRDRMDDVVSVEGELVQQLKNTFESGLGIHSPSDKFKWYGQMIVLGLIQGLSGSKLDSFVNSMVNDMEASFENGTFRASETVNFLSDQGTLDLIGRVSQIDTNSVSAESIAYPLIGTLGTQTSSFGPRSSPGGIGSTNHGGIDLATDSGTPIASALAGTVSQAGWNGGYGQSVTVHTGDLDIIYGHMSRILTSAGASVGKGQQIGLVGSTGNSTGPHLHFEMRRNGTRIDPQPYLSGASIAAAHTLANELQMAYNAKHGIFTMMSGNIPYSPSGGVAQWSSYVLQALQMLGQPASLLGDVLYVIERESGGDPNNTNNWDSNAWIGQNSRGLMQTIPDTFNSYRHPGLSPNIYDPLSNIYAGLNYMIRTYGSIQNCVNPRRASKNGWYGYAVGTRYVPEDMMAPIHKGEAILPASQNPYTNSGGNYLSDMFSSIFNDNVLQETGMNTSALQPSTTSTSESSNDFNGNIIFNITNNNDADGDRFVSNLESELHRILQGSYMGASVR